MDSSRCFWPVLLAFLVPLLPGQAETLSGLGLEARSREQSKRIAALEALLAHGPEGRLVLARALQENEKELAAARGQLLASQSFASARAALEADLLQARREALAHILDENAFRKGFGIAEMQKLVGRVRSLWEQPEGYLSERVKGLAALLEQAREISRYAGPAETPGLAETEAKTVAALRAAIAVDQMDFSAAQLRWNAEVLAWNEGEAPTSANAEELEVARLTNRYRLMMGFRALELDERILRAARAHSQEMEDLDYFAHTSPVPAHADPSTRMRLQGYSGPQGENIATALNAARAFEGWFLSAGHHRNMLSAQASAFAVGRSRGREGSYLWTMNLGAGDSLRGKSLSDLTLLYLQRRRQISAADPKAMLELARWCAQKGLVKEMSEACRIVLRLDPSLEEARELLANRFEIEHKARR